jgi:hypothetical protein
VTSKRNTPKDMTELESSTTDPHELALLIERSGETLSAESVAEMTLDSIEHRRLHIFTHGDLHLRLREQLFRCQNLGACRIDGFG